MKIEFVWIGKEKHQYLKEGIEIYFDRINHYTKAQIVQIKGSKHSTAQHQVKAETVQFKKKMSLSPFTICLDEKGKKLTSVDFSQMMENLRNRSIPKVSFMIGGAYGFHDEIIDKCDYVLSLSNMTLPHDLCRLVLLEQVYRAYTITKNEKYHNP